MKVQPARLAGVKWIEPTVFEDHRGFFMESYNAAEYARNGIAATFVQDNHSLSAEAGVLRGLHYQLHPKAQTKLVRVVAGSILDVVVDLRSGSPTFGQWESFVLSAANKRQLLVPVGFAHGFCTLEANTEVLYKVDEVYSPTHERGIAWNDPALSIDWPVTNPTLSAKDQIYPSLSDAELDFVYQEDER
ncbi:dTDP-4-dehydrorhamnose 3,5-epimerase [Paenibacillus phyllosphaerae]|uniref:dTDP-4-dehydrorhamnose 3,5-epimerase n=1 Tax=Paenibacillus phyllosphaerae TaxID=274593 RepID=A0A7W5AXS0_9BACL|nr:dTDP-4-dehydrorhamnose 3,5-epimerase [Paenibacillus phyllosphaerae]MBB3110537.1 dTDP-4-dehydrorhamnose 3,5-epimerase [Paenibacillus phyllosphaerae]